MKTIGMIGGMSWESTQTYYRLINERINATLGGLHSAKMLLASVDFAEIEECQSKNAWDKAGAILADAAARLEKAGADFVIVCTNTMHKVAPAIADQIKIPLIHIADATAEQLHEAHISKIGLLGTKYTMQEDFYIGKLMKAGIDVLIPTPEDIEVVNSVIFNELCLGKVKEESRQNYLKILHDMKNRGAEGIILGCTEIGMLIQQQHVALPVFDTTIIHAQKAAEMALT